MHYTFQQSKIWEGGMNPLDSNGKKVKVKARSLAKARKQLPDPGMGRSWILIETKENNQ